MWPHRTYLSLCCLCVWLVLLMTIHLFRRRYCCSGTAVGCGRRNEALRIYKLKGSVLPTFFFSLLVEKKKKRPRNVALWPPFLRFLFSPSTFKISTNYLELLGFGHWWLCSNKDTPFFFFLSFHEWTLFTFFFPFGHTKWPGIYRVALLGNRYTPVAKLEVKRRAAAHRFQLSRDGSNYPLVHQ